MKNFISIVLIFISFIANAQDVSINNGWKFITGDSNVYALQNFNDTNWATINIGKSWESQGYKDYDGFAWYRLHIVIPSSIKNKAFLKEKIRIDLGKIDDGDEFYFNGSLIGRNGGGSFDIKQGNYDKQRSYTLPFNDPRILWDRENVIAVRVFDHGGDGGMYEGKYGISVMDVNDFIIINTNDNNFQFINKQVSKKIILQSSSDKYDFDGKLQIIITDPFSSAIVFKQTISADFAKSRPFEYTFKTALPENKSYTVTYSFEESRNKKSISATEEIPYILTPRVSSSPKINGPLKYGVRPGSPFIYKIPATGEKPLQYEVSGLPKGLMFDKNAGIITGSIDAKGSYFITLIVKNKFAIATKNFTIVCGDLIGLTPALGWNSWNCWALSVSDEKIKASAKVMFDKLADYGWNYINIDDGWEESKRNENGEIVSNKKFPDMKSLSDYVHSLGLKIGIYSSPGTLTCGGFLGSYQHEEQDAKMYADWGIDYLKYDWCSYEKIAPAKPSLDDYKKPYTLMGSALRKTNRDILFSFCQYGMGDVWKWGAEVGGNSWRTTGDINDSWESMSAIGFSQNVPAQYSQPGHFNDPDMLVVGKVGWGPSLHNSRLTPDEQYTHISLWSLLSSPLLIGCDMSQLDDFTLNLLTNAEVLAIDQDALGKGAEKVFEKDQIQVWVKQLKDGNKAIGIFNLNNKPTKTTINFSDIKLSAQIKLRDVWRQQELGSFKNVFTTTVPAHGVILLKSHSL